MKEYKTVKLRNAVFKMNLHEQVQEILNKESRMGWDLEQVVISSQGNFIILSRRSNRM